MATGIYENGIINKSEVIIPDGFAIREGDIETGLVIENIYGDRFVRIPPGYTPNGIYVRGFWVSAYYISKGPKGQPKSIAGEYPWTNISFYEADEVAKRFSGSLLFGEEFDRICMWTVQTNAASFEQVFVDGLSRVNDEYTFDIQKTGANPQWMVNNIDSFWGNICTWTLQPSELYEHYRKVRGGIPPIFREVTYPPPSSSAWAKPEEGSPNIGFRIALHDNRLS